MTNAFDLGILHFFNSFAHRSPAWDGLVVYVMNSSLLTGGVITALFSTTWVTAKPR